MMKSSAKNIRNRSSLGLATLLRVIFHGLVLSGQNAQLYVEKEYKTELSFAVSLMEM